MMEYIEPYLVYAVYTWGPALVKVLVILIVFAILAKIVKKVILNAADRLKMDNHLVGLLARTSNIAIILFGLVTALDNIGINVAAIVAGLGLTGFALGFAMKDTISNLISGILILLYRPFEIGDRIGILSYEGVVVSIDLRYTKIDAEGHTVLIPNSKLFSDPITILDSPTSEIHE